MSTWFSHKINDNLQSSPYLTDYPNDDLHFILKKKKCISVRDIPISQTITVELRLLCGCWNMCCIEILLIANARLIYSLKLTISKSPLRTEDFESCHYLMREADRNTKCYWLEPPPKQNLRLHTFSIYNGSHFLENQGKSGNKLEKRRKLGYYFI